MVNDLFDALRRYVMVHGGPDRHDLLIAIADAERSHEELKRAAKRLLIILIVLFIALLAVLVNVVILVRR